MMPNLFGPNPPPAVSARPPQGVTRAARKVPKEPSEVIDLDARRTAAAAHSAAAELNERLESYGLQADFEALDTRMSDTTRALEGVADAAEKQFEQLRTCDRMNATEIGELRSHVLSENRKLRFHLAVTRQVAFAAVLVAIAVAAIQFWGR